VRTVSQKGLSTRFLGSEFTDNNRIDAGLARTNGNEGGCPQFRCAAIWNWGLNRASLEVHSGST